MVEVDRKTFLASLPAGALAVMSHEDKAEALEHYMEDELDDRIAARRGEADGEAGSIITLEELEQEGPRAPRGTGRLFQPTEDEFAPMPEAPTLLDFFRLRFAPANHVLQSATHALTTGQPERTIFACLMHDVVLNLIKGDHGWWGAQLIEPYVDERISWGIRYHGPLRFYADDSSIRRCTTASSDTTTCQPYIRQAYEFARGHRHYAEARLITVNDTYAFQDNMDVDIEVFTDIIGRQFKQPKEGLGYDNSPVAHMWRTMANPNRPL